MTADCAFERSEPSITLKSSIQINLFN